MGNEWKEELNIARTSQVELREELKMKQATYVAEVQSRLQYQKTLDKIVDLLQTRCRDDVLMEDVLAIYESGERGEELTNSKSIPLQVLPSKDDYSPTNYGRRGVDSMRKKSLSSRFFSYFVATDDDELDENDMSPVNEKQLETGFCGLKTFTSFTEV